MHVPMAPTALRLAMRRRVTQRDSRSANRRSRLAGRRGCGCTRSGSTSAAFLRRLGDRPRSVVLAKRAVAGSGCASLAIRQVVPALAYLIGTARGKLFGGLGATLDDQLPELGADFGAGLGGVADDTGV